MKRHGFDRTCRAADNFFCKFRNLSLKVQTAKYVFEVHNVWGFYRKDAIDTPQSVGLKT